MLGNVRNSPSGWWNRKDMDELCRPLSTASVPLRPNRKDSLKYPQMPMMRMVNLFSLVNPMMKAHHLGLDLEVRRTFGISMAKLLSSTLLRLLSVQTQRRPRLLAPRTPFQQRQPLASLAGHRYRPNLRLYWTSTLQLLIKQITILLRAKNPPSSLSFHLERG